MSDKPCSRENGFRVDCIKHYAEVEAENARLKAEVERLTATMEKVISAADLIDERNQHLIAEVERLRKAGDAMAALLSCAGSPPNVVQSWNAAKEGKPPSV